MINKVKELIGFHCSLAKIAVYFDSFGIKNISREILNKSMTNKSLPTYSEYSLVLKCVGSITLLSKNI